VTAEVITDGDHTYPQTVDFNPEMKAKIEYFDKQGWGYTETAIKYKKERNSTFVEGDRYELAGKWLPGFASYASSDLGVDFSKESPRQEFVPVNPSIFNHDFIKELGENFSRRSFEHFDRVMHSHGHSFQEIHILRNFSFKRNADMVLYPGSHEHCEEIVRLATKHNVVIVPYGAGTNVTQALILPENEKRMIVSLDMCRMNKIKWVDRENQMACVESGIYGFDLEKALEPYGVVTGHEPDSAEFSTLGGWIATRASGMKKNTYGNIEDIVCNMTIVTPSGTYSKKSLWPRTSNGPDINHVVMGSEGNMGVITEAVIKVKPIPEKREFGSILFPDFETGTRFMTEMSKQPRYPTSIRMIDNTQFKFGQSLKPEDNSMIHSFIDKVKSFYVVNIKGYNPDKMAACTLLFEGNA